MAFKGEGIFMMKNFNKTFNGLRSYRTESLQKNNFTLELLQNSMLSKTNEHEELYLRRHTYEK
ncbi:hypothetical protein SDC9_181236 [bioreactor metagenome]|jgi:hypothetical protein|uniref:Uncharacterized protein n=1 Tax=bioreactor metagenome TaxID=1076179 RepID=A0A645H3Y0_9ZZZZ